MMMMMMMMILKIIQILAHAHAPKLNIAQFFT